MKKKIILLLLLAFLGLTGCQAKPEIDIRMPTSPPDPSSMRPSYGPNQTP